MLRGKHESDVDADQFRENRGALGRGLLPFAAAFLAGFLFGRRSGGGGTLPAPETVQSERGETRPPAADEQEADDESESEAETGGESEFGAPLSDEVADEVEAVTAPTKRGMPMLGFGTYQIDDYDECVEAVRTAIEMGYRHIDTAEGYDNEDAVGDAIAEADVDREDLFVATKIGPQNLDYDHVLTNAEESLDRLGLDYVDLLYVHWPTGEYEATDTLDAFAELRREGMTEKIGVSNFTVDLLEEALDVSEEPIFANQVEMHPMLQQEDLQEFCARDERDVELVGYSPIARGEVDDLDVLRDIADDHDATPAQVALAWLREKGVTAIPKAASEDHIRENWLSLAVELDDDEVERIDGVDREERVVDPDQAPWN